MSRLRRRRPLLVPPAAVLAGLVAAACASGCSAFRPIDGIPAGALPDEYRLPARTGKTPIDLSLLAQAPPADYRLDAGDVLGVLADGMIGGSDVEPVPVATVNNPGVQPSIGYPIEVDRNGTVTLPRVGAIPVRGRTLDEVRTMFREVAKVQDGPLAGRVMVNIQKKRTYKVLVMRQETGHDTALDQVLNGGASEVVRRGFGQVVELPAYENDVLHALLATGGAPALNAENAVYVIRQGGGEMTGVTEPGPAWGGHTPPPDVATGAGRPTQVVRIPLSGYPGEPLPFSPADVILHDGDIVYIESRSGDFFYTSGLFGGGQYQLPRDYDLDALGAVAIVQASLRNSNSPTKAIGGRSALNKDVTVGASKLIILRPQPDGTNLPIEIDLYDAVHDPRQRVLIRPGDHLVLQYSRPEACAAFVERHFLEGLVLGVASSLFYNR